MTARPLLGHGVGLRVPHYAHVLEHGVDVDFVEVVTENFFGGGGRPFAVLERVRRDAPLVFHGVGLGVGSPEPPSREYLARVKALADRFQPAWLSDHLCWTSTGGHQLHDLLPLPYTEEALERVVRHVSLAQEALGRRLLLENVSSYVAFRSSTLSEWEFLREVAERADALVLLDVNNVLVSAHNHGFSPDEYLAGLPGDRVWQLHLANHADRGAYKLDDHRGAVPEAVWQLFDAALRRYGEVSSSVEWDEDVPPWEVLCAEPARARARAAEVLGRQTPP